MSAAIFWLGAKGGMPKMFCFVTSLMTLLPTVEPTRGFLVWVAGMVIAVVALRERIGSSYGI